MELLIPSDTCPIYKAVIAAVRSTLFLHRPEPPVPPPSFRLVLVNQTVGFCFPLASLCWSLERRLQTFADFCFCPSLKPKVWLTRFRGRALWCRAESAAIVQVLGFTGNLWREKEPQTSQTVNNHSHWPFPWKHAFLRSETTHMRRFLTSWAPENSPEFTVSV